MPTHRKTFRASTNGFSIDKAKQVTAGVQVMFEKSIPNGATDQLISVAVEESTLVSFHLHADQALTVKTNDSVTPQETISLDGIDAESWVTGEGTKPISGDVTALYVTNASGSDATLKLLAGW